MKIFISILVSFLFMSIADSIDSAFNNLVSIDAIVVWGSFLLIDSIFKSISEIGICTYRTTRKNEWSYLWFNILFGLYPYETYKTLCITQGKSAILLLGSTIGVIIRLIVCTLFINTSISLYVFGLSNCIDFGSRSIIYKIVLLRLEKNMKLSNNKNIVS